MSRQLDQISSDAAAKNLSFAQALESLADLELESRNQNAIERRFRLSRLQSRHSIDGFNFKHHKSRMEIKARVTRLLDLEFLDKGTNFIKSSVKVSKTLTGLRSRSAGTATYISVAPMSTPAASTCNIGSIAVPFLLFFLLAILPLCDIPRSTAQVVKTGTLLNGIGPPVLADGSPSPLS